MSARPGRSMNLPTMQKAASGLDALTLSGELLRLTHCRHAFGFLALLIERARAV